VVATIALPPIMILSGLGLSPAALTAGIGAAVYLLLRADIIASLETQGVRFVLAALGVMAFLDVVRFACFATGMGLGIRDRVRRLRRPRRAQSPSEPYLER
jgi:hypothetical protein